MGVIMTGMGDDGARGMDEMHKAARLHSGAGRGDIGRLRHAEGSDRRGGVDRVVPLEQIAREILAADAGTSDDTDPGDGAANETNEKREKRASYEHPEIAPGRRLLVAEGQHGIDGLRSETD